MKALATALSVLKEFSTSRDPLGVSELAELLQLNKSQVSKILGSFRDYGFLEQNSETRKYSVGLRAFALGTRYVYAHSIAREALSVMRKLVDQCGYSATLSIMHGDDVIHLMAVEGPLFVDGRWRVGNLMPYYATSAGKVLLAYRSEADVDALVRRRRPVRLTARTICEPKRFKAVLRDVRERGGAISRGESAPGLAALAVPVFDRGEQPVAALGVIFPDHLVPPEENFSLLPLLHQAARELSIRIGALVYPYGGKPVGAGTRPEPKPAQRRKAVTSRQGARPST